MELELKEQQWGGGDSQDRTEGVGVESRLWGSRKHLTVSRGCAGSWVCSGAGRAGGALAEPVQGSVYVCYFHEPEQ